MRLFISIGYPPPSTSYLIRAEELPRNIDPAMAFFVPQLDEHSIYLPGFFCVAAISVRNRNGIDCDAAQRGG